MNSVSNNKYIAYILLFGMCMAPVNGIAANKQNLRYMCYATTGVAAAATTCAIAEFVYRRQVATKLKHDIAVHKAQVEAHRIQEQKLNQELTQIKSEEHKVEQDRALLSTTAQLVKQMQIKFDLAFDCMKTYDDQPQEKLVEFLAQVQVQVALKNSTVTGLIEELQQDLNKIRQAHENLKVKALDWAIAGNTSYSSQVTALDMQLASLEDCWSVLSVIERYKSLIELNIFLAKNYEQSYNVELALQAQESNADHYAADLDARIRALYSDARYQFAYLSYVDRVQTDLYRLKNLIHAIPAILQDAPFGTPVNDSLSRARALAASLETLVEYVVTTPTYNKEKQYKPEFDRQEARAKQELHEKQERLALEVRESQARIEQEKRITELKLQEERARVKALENKYAEIERERKALEVKERQIALERARIRDGETIQAELHKNNAQWSYQYNAAIHKQNELAVQVNTLKAQNTAELARVNNELTQAKNQIKNHETSYNHLKRDYDALHNKAVHAARTLAILNETNPPFNPDMVDGLRQYIATLKTHAQQARSVLA